MNLSARLRHGRLALAIVALLCVSSSANADGVIRDGVGGISIGRGGTNIAHYDNVGVLLDNPAAMVNIRDRKLSGFSVDVLRCDLQYADPENHIDADVQPYPMGHFGWIRKSDDDLWAAGFGVYTPAGFGTEWDVTHPTLGDMRQKSLGALVKILPAVSARLTDRLSAGAALGVGVSHIRLDGPFHLQSGPIPGAATHLDMDATGAQIAWNLGLQYQISDRTMLGVSYTGETAVSQEGEAEAFVPGLGFSTFDAEVDIAWPRSVGIGLTHSPCRHHRFSTDVIWFDWSDAFDSIDMTLTNASNPAFTGLLGAEFQDSFPLRWRDTVSVRTGYERFLDRGQTLRFGYIYHRNPIPNATLTSYIPAILEHAFSTGYGKQFHHWNFDIAYQFSWGKSQRVTDSALLGGDFDNSDVDSEAHWVTLNVQHRY